MGLIRRINKDQGEASGDANILGVGSVKGNWIASDINAFVEKFINLKRSQKPYVFRPHKIPRGHWGIGLNFRSTTQKLTPMP